MTMVKATTAVAASTLRTALKAGDRHDYVLWWVQDFLGGIAKGERAADAKLHPLGFLCYPAYRSDEYGLCVHAWLPGRYPVTSPTSDMHMHTFDMISRVLAGTVTNHELELDREAAPTHRIFEITKGTSEDVDVFTPTLLDAAPSFRAPTKVCAGEQYAIRRHQYHSADDTVNTEFTVTLMLAENWDESPQRTLVPLEKAESVDPLFQRRLLEPEEARGQALAILALLD